MEHDKLVDLLVQDIDNKVDQLQDALGSFAAKDFAEYSKMCGEIKGLLTARQYMTDLTRNLEHSDE
jgi:hypothetical protein|tara:strand:+ start:5483 stop:5680 length:198 start_codon:yes stop_codon:yes gene_type:complete